MVEDLVADALDIVADRVVKRQCLAGIELERCKDNEKVVFVGMVLIELLGDLHPGLARSAIISSPVLYDRHVPDALEPRHTLGLRRQRRNRSDIHRLDTIAQPMPARGIRRCNDGHCQSDRETGHSLREAHFLLQITGR